MITLQAHADADDTISLTSNLNVEYNSNLFSLANGISPQAALGTSGKSDLITTGSVGVKLNKPYSLQRFELEATVVNNRYRTFDYLDFTALNYAGAWRWMITPTLHGSLSATRSESLNSFTDSKRYDQRNIRTDENQRLDTIYELDGSWRLLAGASRTTRTNRETLVQEGDTQTNSVTAGIRYDFRSGTSLAFQTRFGHGEYTNRPTPIPATLLDNQYDVRENGFQLNWRATGKTLLDARISYLEHTSADYSARNFAGMTGSLNFSWEVTGKTVLSAIAARELSSYQTLTSSYTQSDRIGLIADWRIREKAGLRVSYNYAQRDYLGGIIASSTNGRLDTTRTGMVALDWQPSRGVMISASLQRTKQTSNQSDNDFAANSANLSAQVTF